MKNISLTRLSSDALQKRQMDAIKGGTGAPSHSLCNACFCPKTETDSVSEETRKVGDEATAGTDIV